MLTEYWPFQKFYKTKLEISDSERDQIKYLLYNFKDSSDDNQTTTYKNINILNLPVLKNLKNQIIKILESKNLILTNNWAQLYLKGHSHEPHTHVTSFYSGVIYVDGNGIDGTNWIDSYSGKIHVEKFEKNTLILFPSNIIHYVHYQTEDNGRIIISFNTKENIC